jgi:hypothetical protein
VLAGCRAINLSRHAQLRYCARPLLPWSGSSPISMAGCCIVSSAPGGMASAGVMDPVELLAPEDGQGTSGTVAPFGNPRDQPGRG